MRFVILLLATVGYVGFVPLASGTAGSAVGALLTWGAIGTSMNRFPLTAMLIFAAAFAASCWICGRAERILDQPDSPRIVLDETFGMIATMFLNPLGGRYLTIGFVLFRLFDIIKPFPAGYIDRNLRGGAGVMLDDLAAAVYANLLLRLAARFV